MPFITFIYRIGRNKRTYYGKYVANYISDDHEGLDTEVKYDLLRGLNEYRKQKNLEPLKSDAMLHLGIMSFSNDDAIPVYSSDDEIKCFDFYTTMLDYKRKLYVNGLLIT